MLWTKLFLATITAYLRILSAGRLTSESFTALHLTCWEALSCNLLYPSCHQIRPVSLPRPKNNIPITLCCHSHVSSCGCCLLRDRSFPAHSVLYPPKSFFFHMFRTSPTWLMMNNNKNFWCFCVKNCFRFASLPSGLDLWSAQLKVLKHNATC